MFYKTSTNPLPDLYLSSTRLSAWALVFEHRVGLVFPPWEQIIPTLGTNYSHLGNKTFPPWEYWRTRGRLRGGVKP